ncbi:XRE family transcriptional regulator [Desulfosporosinus sp. HMP52]|uniref:XRE family transcriptional regulator n=1 Tax=Desulfosporosinus sp. HMP52 TaxID=1487923 RepID=UPI0009E02CE0|nr:XRE family transcriptional regulator [Desulfosporosinus sp. HMP52]
MFHVCYNLIIKIAITGGILVSVGGRIAQMREDLGLSQTELANKAGLKPPTISQYESGLRNPSYEALIKLSNALNVTTDYLITGKEIQASAITDSQTKILLHLLQRLPKGKKDTLLDYAIFLSRGTEIVEGPVFSDASDYANLWLKKVNASLPIDVHLIADQLGVKIIEDDLQMDYEGLLIKGERNLILLNRLFKSSHQRKKFTIAMLLGHIVLPWHVKTQYGVRKSNSSTLRTNDIEEIEATHFAAKLTIPSVHFEKDFAKKPTLDILKNLAYEKYDVSLFSMCNRLVEHTKDKHAVIQSEDGQIIETFPGKRLLKGTIPLQSKAVSFYYDLPKQEETRYSKLPATDWFEDGKLEEYVIEESIFNPKIGKVLTLLTVKTKDE